MTKGKQSEHIHTFQSDHMTGPATTAMATYTSGVNMEPLEPRITNRSQFWNFEPSCFSGQ